MFSFNFLGALRSLGATVATFHPSQVCSATPPSGSVSKGFHIAMPILLMVILQSCIGPQAPMDIPDLREESVQKTTEDYIHIQVSKEKATLILFPCFPCNAEQTLAEFNIKEKAKNQGLSLLLMNFNRKLWLSKEEKEALGKQILKALEKNRKPIYLGGFSSGGNMALLMANHLKQQSKLNLKGVFVVDSPIELQALYEASLRIAKRKAHPDAIAESNYLIQLFEQNFGNTQDSLHNYKKYSPFSSTSKGQQNLNALKNTKLRFYTEPDADWWMENRKAPPEDSNAPLLRNAAKRLKDLHFNQVELIETRNRGYRADGRRHPHSWSIVDVEDLVEWMKL